MLNLYMYIVIHVQVHVHMYLFHPLLFNGKVLFLQSLFLLGISEYLLNLQ